MVEALQTLYIALGGKAKDFTATTTPEAIIAIAKVVEWSKVWLAGGDIAACMDAQIAAYRADAEKKK